MSEGAAYFRTIEQGQMPWAQGILKLVTVKSPAMGRRADLSIFRPKALVEEATAPVVTLLHGVYGSHWAWALSGKAPAVLNRLIDAGEVPPMLLVMPSDGLWGDGSSYLNRSAGQFEDWIVRDVPEAVVAVMGEYWRNAPQFIAGLSMGGYGALRIGAKFPKIYRAFAGHSSITRFEELAQFVEEPLEDYGIGDPDGASVLAALRERGIAGPRFRFDCGVDDPLIEGNRTLSRQLSDEGFEFEYAEHAGGHEWPYWETHIADTFRFFARQLD